MSDQTPPIRMVFAMTRQEHPRLYDDLIRFPKGTKRINRLRTLAHDGLLVQGGVAGQAMRQESLEPREDRDHGQLTNQIFESPLSE